MPQCSKPGRSRCGYDKYEPAINLETDRAVDWSRRRALVADLIDIAPRRGPRVVALLRLAQSVKIPSHIRRKFPLCQNAYKDGSPQRTSNLVIFLWEFERIA